VLGVKQASVGTAPHNDSIGNDDRPARLRIQRLARRHPLGLNDAPVVGRQGAGQPQGHVDGVDMFGEVGATGNDSRPVAIGLESMDIHEMLGSPFTGTNPHLTFTPEHFHFNKIFLNK
jgi:hypothetical protein